MSLALPMMHPTKRRRLEASTSTLSKPFRSPSRVDANKRNAQTDNVEQRLLRRSDARDETNETDDLKDEAPTCMRAALSANDDAHSLRKSLSSPVKHASIETPAAILSYSPMQTQQSKPHQLLNTTQQIQTPEPSTSNSDTDLTALISKWRHVSRAAAEVVFNSARDKVTSMGGMNAWRKTMCQNASERSRNWDEQGEQRGMQKKMREEDEDGEKEEEASEDEDEHEEENFTMETMLRQMGIDLDILGWSVEAQGWVD